MKPFDYRTSAHFLKDFYKEELLMLYGAFGGTALYLQQIQGNMTLEENIKHSFLMKIGYLYEEPLLLIRQEVQEPGIYSAIIEAIAGGGAKANEISTKTGEKSAKCLKYISVLKELGIVYKETPYGEKASSRKTIYGISDFMFRFWYRYVFGNRTLLEMDAADIVWERRIKDTYNDCMGLVFEQICCQYLMEQNRLGKLPVLFTSIGRWRGSNPYTKQHEQVKIDLIAEDSGEYLICECKWRNELLGVQVLDGLRMKADVFNKFRKRTWYVLFSKSGFTDTVIEMARADSSVILVSMEDMVCTKLQSEILRPKIVKPVCTSIINAGGFILIETEQWRMLSPAQISTHGSCEYIDFLITTFPPFITSFVKRIEMQRSYNIFRISSFG